MESPLINFEEFDLYFLNTSTESNEEDVEDDYEVDNDEIKENMKSLIPMQTTLLGTIEAELENWTTWSIKDDYYIHPLTNDEFDWALFRITWDDNWGRWDWSFDARLRGFKDNQRDAARFILDKLWEKWHIDLKNDENEAFVDFLGRV